MPVHYYIDRDLDMLVAEAVGVLTDRDLIEAFDRVVKETHGEAMFKPHLFLTDASLLAHNLSLDALIRVKENIEAWGQTYPGRNVKTALVVTDAIDGAVAAMWKALTDAYPAVGSQVKLFVDRAAAIAWLRS